METETAVEETERRPSKLPRLGPCEMCREKDAKYKCPACETKSCSLACVKEHKTSQLCTGIRDRVKMIHKEDMDNLTLLSDYRFLEEIDHKLEDNLRNPLLRQANIDPANRPRMPHYMHRLREEAWKRGTTLKFFPYQFSTRRNNATRFITAEGVIRWHVKLIFHQADLTLSEVGVDEHITINKLLARYLDPNSDLPTDVKEKLEYYQSASFGGISVLVKTDVEGQGTVFQELYPNKSLRLNLANKTVVENPTLYVVLKHHTDSYLGYEGGQDDDLFPDTEEVKDAQKADGLCYFDAESDTSGSESESEDNS